MAHEQDRLAGVARDPLHPEHTAGSSGISRTWLGAGVALAIILGAIVLVSAFGRTGDQTPPATGVAPAVTAPGETAPPVDDAAEPVPAMPPEILPGQPEPSGQAAPPAGN